MERQHNPHPALSFYSLARAAAVLSVISVAASFGRSQTLQGDAETPAVASSDTASLPGPPVRGLAIFGADQPPASEKHSSVGTLSAAPSRPPLIVIGFAGGFIRRTSTVHGEVRLATDLEKRYGSRLHAEVFENHHGDEAYREILRLVGASNTAIPAETKRAARIILYGHSWGASEAVEVARQLGRDGIPVLLLVQVDGVSKGIHDDGVIPANVAQAINFYQSDGLLHGRSAIRAANPTRTKIIGNFRFSYKATGVPCPGYPWYTKVFTKPHIEIENDPRVWNDVEALILSKATPQKS